MMADEPTKIAITTSPMIRPSENTLEIEPIPAASKIPHIIADIITVFIAFTFLMRFSNQSRPHDGYVVIEIASHSHHKTSVKESQQKPRISLQISVQNKTRNQITFGLLLHFNPY